MSPEWIGIIAFVILFALIGLGMPIGAAMALVGFIGLFFLVSGVAAFTKLTIVAFHTATSYDLAVLPLFVLMAHVVFATGMGHDMYRVAYRWLGHMPGGLAQAAVAGSAGFAAVSASSIATASTIGLVSIKEMQNLKYDNALATGCVAAGGTMGVLIPPSGGLIIYGILTGTSIGKLFAAGIIPGILEAIFYMAVINIMCIWKPSLGPRGEKFSLKEKVTAFNSCGEVIALAIFVLAGIIVGWFTPTEAGGVGAAGAIVAGLIRKRLTWERMKTAIVETLKTSGMIYAILIGAFIFNYFLAPTNIPYAISEFVKGLNFSPMGVLVVVLIVYIFLGMFLDTAAMTVLTIPIFFPLITSLGFDAVWFGIIFMRMAEIAMITPPVGMNVYVIKGIAQDVPMETIFKGIMPFLFADFCHVTFLILFPKVVLFLPGKMM